MFALTVPSRRPFSGLSPLRAPRKQRGVLAAKPWVSTHRSRAPQKGSKPESNTRCCPHGAGQGGMGQQHPDNMIMKTPSQGKQRWFYSIAGSRLPAVSPGLQKFRTIPGETKLLRSKDSPCLPSGFSSSPWSPEAQQTSSAESSMRVPERPGVTQGGRLSSASPGGLGALSRCSGAFAGHPSAIPASAPGSWEG